MVVQTNNTVELPDIGFGIISFKEPIDVAGESDKATAVQKETEVREEKAEESRKKVFKKDQDDLEKALGF